MRELEEIEARWLTCATSAIAKIVRGYPNEQIYAGAFHILYADYTVILSPALAANNESSVTFHEDRLGTVWSTRWAPPEWSWNVIDEASDAMAPLYSRLTEKMSRASHAEWDKMLDMHDQVIARVARAITVTARGQCEEFCGLAVPSNFVVAILAGDNETEEYNRLVRASVDPVILATLEGILLPEV